MQTKGRKLKSLINWRGDKYQLIYEDTDSFDDLDKKHLQQIYGVCFCDDKIVIVRGESGEDGKGWGLVGGHIEKDESIDNALKREVKEEVNMRVLKSKPIGFQKVINPDGSFDYQLRCVCSVEPLGEFVEDPDGSITEIKLINPKDYKKYFDWGEIGDRIIKRALELKEFL